MRCIHHLVTAQPQQAARSERKRWWLVALRAPPLRPGKTDARRSQSAGTALCCYSHFVQYFPFRPPRARSRPTGRNMNQDHLSLRSRPPGFSWCLNGGFRLDVANTRNSNQGFRRGEIAQTSTSGSHPPAHRWQRVARADHDDWDHEAVRFERHAPAQRLVEDTRAGYDPGLEFELPQTVRLKACAFHCAGRDLPT